MVVATSGTRLKILQILLQKGEASVSQLSTDLDLASATVRRHLNVLLRDHLVDYHQVRKSLGRPEYAFTLTDEGQEVLPKRYQGLLSAVLSELDSMSRDDLKGHDGKELSDLVFLRMAEKMASSAQDNQPQDRLSSLLDILREQDFLPVAKATGSGVRIFLHNCPYRSVAQSQASVCTFDKALISRVLQVPAERQQCIRNGDRSCCYYVPLKT